MRRLLLVFCTVLLLLAGPLFATDASAGSGGASTSACSYANAWCICSVYHWTSGHDDVTWYGYRYGYYTTNYESRYVGAGWSYYWLWFDGAQRGDIFTVASWGDVAMGGCGQST